MLFSCVSVLHWHHSIFHSSCFQKDFCCHFSTYLHPRLLAHHLVSLDRLSVAVPASLSVSLSLSQVPFFVFFVQLGGKPLLLHINFPFLYLSSPQLHLLHSDRDRTGVCSSRIVFVRIVRGTAGCSGKHNILALNWKEYFESPSENAASFALQ